MSMTFDFLNAQNEQAVALADTVTVTDPWGFGMTFEVLRSDHEKCRAFDDRHPETAIGALQSRGMLMQMTGATGTDQLDAMAQKLEQRGMSPLQQDLDKSRKKLSTVALVSWSGITANGADVPCEPIAALHLLGFRGVAYREGNGPIEFKTAAEWERLKNTLVYREAEKLEAGKSSKVLTFFERFEGDPRTTSGQVIVIPRTRTIDGKIVAQPQGGNTFGAALTMLLLQASIEASATLAKAKEADAESFEPSPDTVRDSGGSETSSALDSESVPPGGATGATTAE
jgi:hypothetical protein